MPEQFDITCKQCGFIIGVSEIEITRSTCNYCLEERAFLRRMFSNDEEDIGRLEKIEDEVMDRYVTRKCEQNETIKKIRNLADITELELEDKSE